MFTSLYMYFAASLQANGVNTPGDIEVYKIGFEVFNNFSTILSVIVILALLTVNLYKNALLKAEIRRLKIER